LHREPASFDIAARLPPAGDGPDHPHFLLRHGFPPPPRLVARRWAGHRVERLRRSKPEILRVARRKGGGLAAAAALAAIIVSLAAPAEPATLEDAVKATYLYKFEPFIEWPQSAFSSPTSPIELCLLADDTFAALLQNAVRGEHVGPRGFEVRRVSGPAAVGGCQVLYIGVADEETAAAMLDAVRGSPVLTVTDSERGAKGIINFVVRDAHVRFEIDVGAAARNGLAISSKLLSLAVSVKPKA